MAGAGVARELALRGVSVALVEKGDFASATTSQSSKLIHGGLRYLELFDFGLVRESLRERETLRRLAPHLVRPLPFLVPIYRDSSRSLIKVRIGLKLYDWLTPGRKRERYRVLPAVDALSLEPALRAGDLRGAGYYFDDLLIFPERLCLENILSACRLGARAFNYAQVAEVTRDRRGAITGVRVRDLLTGRVATLGARIVVNATGPWVDEVRAERGGFISIPGTKLTCCRSLAEELGDQVMHTLGRRGESRSERIALDGTDDETPRREAHAWLDVSGEAAATGLGRDTLETLVSVYGRGWTRVLDLAGKVAGGTERLCPSNPDVVAELHHAVQDEMAVSLQDVLLRRTGIGTSRCQGQDCAESIGQRMAQLAGWTPRRLDAELEAYHAHVARSHRFRT